MQAVARAAGWSQYMAASDRAPRPKETRKRSPKKRPAGQQSPAPPAKSARHLYPRAVPVTSARWLFAETAAAATAAAASAVDEERAAAQQQSAAGNAAEDEALFDYVEGMFDDQQDYDQYDQQDFEHMCDRCGGSINPTALGLACNKCSVYFHKTCGGRCDCGASAAAPAPTREDDSNGDGGTVLMEEDIPKAYNVVQPLQCVPTHLCPLSAHLPSYSDCRHLLIPSAFTQADDWDLNLYQAPMDEDDFEERKEVPQHDRP
jgi:hypothetical protein